MAGQNNGGATRAAVAAGLTATGQAADQTAAEMAGVEIKPLDPMTVLFDGPEKPAAEGAAEGGQATGEATGEAAATEETPAKEEETPAEEAGTEAAAAAEATPTEETAAGAVEETPAAGEPAQQPGTPDKVIQQLQQDLAAATRKLVGVEEKLAAGTATAADRRDAAAAQRKIDSVRQRLAERGQGKEMDPFEAAPELGEALVEQAGEVETLKQRLEKTEQLLGQMQQDQHARQIESQWAREQAKYPGVDVRGVWEKAVTDAAGLTGIDLANPNPTPAEVRILNNAANQLFSQRAAAVKRGTAEPAAGGAAAAAGKGKPSVKGAPVTRGGARVSQPAQAVANSGTADPEQAYVQAALGLVT